MRRLLTWTRVKKVIIHPFVFAVFPVMSLYIHNMGKGYLGEAIGTMVVALLVAGALWLLVNLIVRNLAKSAIIISLFFFLFFSYGHAISAFTAILEKTNLLEKTGFLVEGRSSQPLWLATWGLLFVIGSILISKLPGNLRTVTNFLNVVALALATIMVVNLVVGSVNTFLMPRIGAPRDQAAVQEATVPADPTRIAPPGGGHRRFLPLVVRTTEREGDSETDQHLAQRFISSWQQELAAQPTNAASSSYPDIYYIILDAYARTDFLGEIYHIDNSEFLSFLAERGFYVADQGRANYPATMLSLSSSLNFMYLDQVAEQVGKRSTNHWPLVVMIRNNKAFQEVQSRGYSIMAFSSGYGISDIKDADIYMAPSGWRPTEFQNILMDSTPLIFLKKTQDQVRRELVLYAFDHLADATEIDGPVFVFAHIPAPHPPYVFGADGEHIRSRPEGDYEYEELVETYGNQLQFVTKKTQAAIDEILTRSPTPPIIIIQSDHGPGGYSDLAQKLSILNAYYFPDQKYGALSEGITPVNTFRIVFNQYLGTDYDLLENRSYVSGYEDSPYLFRDVTDQVTNHK